jgi:hypothetical protein
MIQSRVSRSAYASNIWPKNGKISHIRLTMSIRSLDTIPASVLRKLLLLSMVRAKQLVNSWTSRKRRWEEKYRSREY